MATNSWQSDLVRLTEMLLLGPTFIETTLVRLRGMPQTSKVHWGDGDARGLQLLQDPIAFGRAWWVNVKLEWAAISIVMHVMVFCFVSEYSLFQAAMLLGAHEPDAMGAILGLLAASIYAFFYTARPMFDPADGLLISPLTRSSDRRTHVMIAAFPVAAAAFIVNQQTTWPTRAAALLLYAVVVYGTVLLTAFVVLAARRLPASEDGDIVWHRLAVHWFPQSDASRAVAADLLALSLSDEMEAFEVSEKPDMRNHLHRWNDQCLEVWGIVCQVFDAWRDTYDRMDDVRYHNARRVRLVWEIVLAVLTCSFLAVEMPFVVGAACLHLLPHEMTPAMVVGSALFGFWFAHDYVMRWFKCVAREVPLFSSSVSDRETNELLALADVWRKYRALYTLNARFCWIALELSLGSIALALMGFHLFGIAIALNLVVPIVVCLFASTIFARMPAFEGHITGEYWINAVALQCSPAVRSTEVPKAAEELEKLRRSGATSTRVYQRTWILCIQLLLSSWKRPRPSVEQPEEDE